MTLLGYGVTHVYDPEEWDSGITDKDGYLHIRDYIDIKLKELKAEAQIS